VQAPPFGREDPGHSPRIQASARFNKALVEGLAVFSQERPGTEWPASNTRARILLGYIARSSRKALTVFRAESR
jgi:hypothetical protein